MKRRTWLFATLTCATLMLFFLIGHHIGMPGSGFAGVALALAMFTLVSKKLSKRQLSKSSSEFAITPTKLNKHA